MSGRRIAAIGVFDGVHTGHRYLLEQLKSAGNRDGLQPLAVSFTVPPAYIIDLAKAPAMLCTATERRARLELMGIEVLMLSFEQVRRLTAEQFLAMLHSRYAVDVLLAGYDTRFGSDRLVGRELAAAGDRAGVRVVHALEFSGTKVSSTLVRKALSEGDVSGAAELLGRNYTLGGVVATGQQIGRTIGFPTANVVAPAHVAVPGDGVYAARCLGRPAVVNIGRRPTVEANGERTIEVHILGFEGDLYGREIDVEFVVRLRGELKFGSLQELKQQIARDIEICKEMVIR